MIRDLFRRLLEYLGILTVTINIGNEEIHIIESLRILFYFRILSIKSEHLYDMNQFNFIIERFIERNTTHKVKRINLTLSSTSIIPLFFSFTGIQREKIQSAILWEIERNIPLSLEEAYFGYKIVSQISEGGTTSWNVLAVVAKRDEIDRYLDTFGNLGIIVEDISYLPINIMSVINIGKTENAVGYVYISEHFIELYILLNKKIIKFAHHTGEYSEISPVTMRNVIDYFAEFIKRRLAFLERIVVIAKDQSISQSLSESLIEALNIFTHPASKEDFHPFLKKNIVDQSIYDLIGFVYHSYIRLRISSNTIKKVHIQDVLTRAMIIVVFLLDLFTLAFFSHILAARNMHNLVIMAQKSNIPIDNIQNPKVKDMAIKLREIREIIELKNKQAELSRKIEEIKSSGIQSSSFKIVLGEICRLIPYEVWINKLNINNRLGEISGYAISSDGLENFIVYLVNSRVVQNVVLKSAKLVKNKKSTMIEFNITFGVI